MNTEKRLLNSLTFLIQHFAEMAHTEADTADRTFYEGAAHGCRTAMALVDLGVRSSRSETHPAPLRSVEAARGDVPNGDYVRCRKCGRDFKGQQGLNQHKAKMH